MSATMPRNAATAGSMPGKSITSSRLRVMGDLSRMHPSGYPVDARVTGKFFVSQPEDVPISMSVGCAITMRGRR